MCENTSHASKRYKNPNKRLTNVPEKCARKISTIFANHVLK